MAVWRRVGGAAMVMGMAGSATLFMVSPASAHGATSSPASRGQLCGERAAGKRSAACRAARAVSGRRGIADWDNLRLANVNGRDRQVVPDGKLCSGGIPRFRGLDLARDDWPATTLTSGAVHKFLYRVTIPHPGKFKFYVTKDGYDPTRPLRWADLERRPFLSVTNPRRVKGVYVMRGRLPRNKSGRHLIYVIWQTNPDTYYSCSDVVFKPPATPSPDANAATDSGAAGASQVTDVASRPAASWVPVAAGGGGALVLGAGLIAMLIRRTRRKDRPPVDHRF